MCLRVACPLAPPVLERSSQCGWLVAAAAAPNSKQAPQRLDQATQRRATQSRGTGRSSGRAHTQLSRSLRNRHCPTVSLLCPAPRVCPAVRASSLLSVLPSFVWLRLVGPSLFARCCSLAAYYCCCCCVVRDVDSRVDHAEQGAERVLLCRKLHHTGQQLVRHFLVHKGHTTTTTHTAPESRCSTEPTHARAFKLRHHRTGAANKHEKRECSRCAMCVTNRGVHLCVCSCLVRFDCVPPLLFSSKHVVSILLR